MVKSTIKDSTNVQYPYIKRGTRTRVVVLFSSKEKGTVVNSGESSMTVGKYLESWDMDDFETYDSPVIIQNDI